MKKLLIVLLLSACAFGQTTFRYGSLDKDNHWTGKQTFDEFEVSGPFSVLSLNNVQMADIQYGANACVKISNAISSLPSTGGTVDARGLQGSQSCSSDPFAGVTKPVTVLIGAATITSSVGWTMPSNAALIGLGKGQSHLVFSGPSELTNAIAVNMSADSVEISGLDISGAGNSATVGIKIPGASNIRVHHSKISGFSKGASSGEGLWITDSHDIWVEDNEFTNNGTGTANGLTTQQTSADISAGGTSTWVHRRLYIRRNYVHDSFVATALAFYNTIDSEFSGNWIDENNVTFTGAAITGYGIMVYTQAAETLMAKQNRITNNHIQNTAGIGIYVQGNTRTLVTSNILIDTVKQMVVASLMVGAISAQGADISVAQGERSGHVIADNVINGVNSGNASGTGAGDGIDLNEAVGAIVKGNSITNAYRNGIFLNNGSEGVLIEGNTINKVNTAIYVPLTTSGLIIKGNTIKRWGDSANTHAINIAGLLTDSIIKDNVIIAPATTGLSPIIITNTSSTRNLISGNVTSQSMVLPITNTVLASNVATYTTSMTTGLLYVGQSVVIAGSTHDATFNGTMTIASIVDASKFTVAITHADIATSADSATATFGGASAIGIDYRGTFSRITNNIVNKSTNVGINANTASANNVIENNTVISAASNAIVANGATSLSIVRNNWTTGGASIVANALGCNGNDPNATLSYDFGDSACAIVATIDATGKGTFNGGVVPSSTSSTLAFYKVATHASVDLASVATAACSAETTETITGAALGDNCTVDAGSTLQAGTFFACHVTAADTAKWQLCNLSGGAVDRASDTYTIRVLR